MQVANDYERDVFNGDLGVIIALDLQEAELTVSFEGREVVYGFGELDELVLAYATTIHKSQGSEYPAVVIPLAILATCRPRKLGPANSFGEGRYGTHQRVMLDDLLSALNSSFLCNE